MSSVPMCLISTITALTLTATAASPDADGPGRPIPLWVPPVRHSVVYECLGQFSVSSAAREGLEWPYTEEEGVPPPWIPLHQTKVTIVGTNKIYNWENLVEPSLVHKLLGPRPPPPPPPLSSNTSLPSAPPLGFGFVLFFSLGHRFLSFSLLPALYSLAPAVAHLMG